MVNASKILTVSYGTFSCTLEGFDEPFSTMRSIAEYFRDLAADDRYFGAEPPTPDAEMLHRIAEREIKRRVEAKIEDNGVVLRQVEDQSDHAPAPVHAPVPAAAHAPMAAAEAPAEVAAEPVAEPVEEVDDSVAAKLARIRAAVARSRAEPEPLLNSVFVEDEHAEPLYEAASISDAFDAAQQNAAAAPAPEAGAEADLTEADEIDALDDTGLLDATVDETAEDVPFEDEVEAEDAIAGDVAAAVEVEAEAEAAAEPEVDAEEEIAEVDAVEAEAEAEVEEAEVETEEQVAEAKLDAETEISEAPETEAEDQEVEAETDTEMAEAEVEAEAEEDTAAQPDETEASTGAEEEDEALDLASMLDVAEPEAAAAEDTAVEDTAVDENVDAEPDLVAMLDAAVADTVAEEAEDETSEADDEAPFDLSGVLDLPAADEAPLDLASVALEAPILPDTAAADDGFGMDSVLAEAEAAFEPTDADAEPGEPLRTDDAEPAIAAPRVRVMKMSREEFDAQFEEIEEDADAAAAKSDVDDIRETLGDTGLSPEDEEDLINELAALERGEIYEADEDAAVQEDRPDGVSETLEALVAEAAEAGSDEPGPLPSGEAGEASVDRLLARADTALEDGEGSRRRSAIAHLKAAVAAVRADGKSAKETADAESARAMGQFRDDLAHAVRPETTPAETPKVVASKPARASAESRRERPRRSMPPLMLVSEQRIDKSAAADDDAGPVRPRRIQADDLDKELENELFVDETAQDADEAAGNIFTETGDFQGFVAETGAEGIQELLEASLAFGINVEGAQYNSRPQIMIRMLSLFEDGSVSREDGLRAFGVLLREGRIHRAKRGQFLLPETSRFYQGDAPEKPEANMAG